MIKKTVQLSAFVILFSLNNAALSSCKEKKKTDEVTTTPAKTEEMPSPQQVPVTISADDSLRQNLQDATKDFPSVTTTVNDGVVTLTGDIQRSDLKRLMESLHSLHPKKIENQLTIK